MMIVPRHCNLHPRLCHETTLWPGTGDIKVTKKWGAHPQGASDSLRKIRTKIAGTLNQDITGTLNENIAGTLNQDIADTLGQNAFREFGKH